MTANVFTVTLTKRELGLILDALEFEYLNSKGKRRKANGNKSE